MKYGIYLPNFGPFGDAKLLANLALDAETAGWDGFFIWDHIAGMNFTFVDPWVALAAIAVKTQRIRIGTTVTPLPRRRPWKVARETVSIDHLSNGRLTLGVGIGGGKWEWDDLGEETDLKIRGDILDEALAILNGLWSGKPFQYEGRHFHISETTFLPTPIQVPRIPIWVGGFWPNKGPFRRAARFDGVFPLFAVDSESKELVQLKEAINFVNEQRSFTDSIDIVCTGFTDADQPDMAKQTIEKRADLGMTWWLEAIAPYRYGLKLTDEWPVDDLHKRILQGPPKY